MRVYNYSKRCMTAYQIQIVENLKLIGLVLEREMKKSMRGKSPPASLPGEIPHVRSGTGRRSIFHEVDATKQILRVGSNLVYMKHLEIGTRKMAARPWIRPALKKLEKEIQTMMKRGI